MTSFTFNKNSNPITPFFLLSLEEYLFQGEAVTDVIEEAQAFITTGQGELSRDVYQGDLSDYHHHIIQTMDDYLCSLNYFKSLTKFERMKIFREQKDYIDQHLPAIAMLKSDKAIDKEIREAIDTCFEALDIVRGAMDQEQTNEILNISTHADSFTEETGMARFLDKDDMDDRMEYNFWLNFSRRLHFYPLSEQMADHLDQAQNDPEERCEVIRARLCGKEQEMFPAHMCTLDGFTDEEIEMAKHIIAEEDAQNAENELDDDGKPDGMASVTNIFSGDAAHHKPKPANKNGGATILPMKFFRHRKDKDENGDKPEPPTPPAGPKSPKGP